MAHRSSQRGARAISQKRLTSWFQFVPVETGVTAAVILFSLNAAALALRPFTIVRTRFLLSIISDQAAVSEIQMGALGMAIVSDQAAAIGVTAVPTPITDMGSDLWFFHQLLYNEFSFLTAAGFEEGGLAQYEADSKAMRKVDIGQDLVIVAEPSATSDGFITRVGGRMLVKVN